MCESLADLIHVVKAAGGRTPSVNQSFSSGMAHAANQATIESRVKALKGDCLERDGYRCAVSGVYDFDSIVSGLVKEPAPEEAGIANCDGAHIIPHAMGTGSIDRPNFEVTSIFVYQLHSSIILL